jgi:hypothetical protein
MKTASSGSNGMWYESDLYAALYTTAYGFTFNTYLTAYTYPNGAFNTITELGFTTGFDDVKYIWDPMGVKNFSLKPYVGTFIELDDGNGSEDWYWELGLNPTYTLDAAATGISASVYFPIKIGGSFDGYYIDGDGSNSTFGYSSVAAKADFSLPVPAKYGTWTLTPGVEWLHLFAASADNTNNDERNQFIGSVNLNIKY